MISKNEYVNPLRDPDDNRLNRIAGPSGLVLFGVTGDLARKKLIPAVYDLANRGLLPPGFGLVGFARRDWKDQDFEKVVHDSVREYARTPWSEDVWKQLANGIRFVAGDFDDDAAFDRLKLTIDELDATRGTNGNHAFYLSIPPKSFPQVTRQLSRSGLADPKPDTFRRVVIEKPFGSDLQTARELNQVVEAVKHYVAELQSFELSTVKDSWMFAHWEHQLQLAKIPYIELAPNSIGDELYEYADRYPNTLCVFHTDTTTQKIVADSIIQQIQKIEKI